MCGRFERTSPRIDLLQRFDAQLGLPTMDAPKFNASYNVAPTQMIASVIEDKGKRILVEFEWGLRPGWAKAIKFAPINARCEEVASNGMFRTAFKSRRCLVPANGFYEWQKLDTKTKKPFHIGLPDRELYAFAGLWEEMKTEAGVRRTCTIITTAANETVEPIHNRMPVILTPDVEEIWLDEENDDMDELLAVLRPYSDKMEAYPVGPRVGNVKNNDTDLLNSL